MVESDAKKEEEKKYHTLTNSKRRTQIGAKEKGDKYNPKIACSIAKGQKEDITRDLRESNILKYVTQLYRHVNVGHINENEVTQD